MTDATQYLYEVLVTFVENGDRTPVGQYYTNAAPPLLGSLFNPIILNGQIGWKDNEYRVTKVTIIPTEFSDLSYVGKASNLTHINIEISPIG